MADVVRTVLTAPKVPRLVVRAELTLTALQATFWIALIVVSAGAVFAAAPSALSGPAGH